MPDINEWQPKKIATCGSLCEKLIKECKEQGLRVVTELTMVGNPGSHNITRGWWVFRKELAEIHHFQGWNEGDQESLNILLWSSDLEEKMYEFAKQWEETYLGCKASIGKWYV